MKQKYLALTLGTSILSIIILLASCRKINEATSLGADVLPIIDNVTTFDTSLAVEVYNGLFTLLTDSTRSNYGSEHFLGLITNDPLFGKTDARVFVELKPPGYPFAFNNKPSPDSLKLDSVVLILDYAGTYGDTVVPQTINVYEMDQSNDFRTDTAYLVRENHFTYSNLLGTRSVIPATLNDSVKAYQDSSGINQLRIRLDNSFGQRLLMYDSIKNSPNNAYGSDSLFRSKFKGFAIQSVAGGNAVMALNISTANTRLAIYYKHTHGTTNFDLDTAVSYFVFKDYLTSGIAGSASANYVQRDYTGTPLLAAQGGTAPDPLAFMQMTPGSFATIKVPGLAGLDNRLIHRAELIMEQVYDQSDTLFGPSYLYLDVFDPALNGYRTMPYDLVYNSTGSLNLGPFGISPFNTADPLGHNVKQWRFNISRYIQNVVNDVVLPYDFRLSAPYYVTEYYKPTASSAEAMHTFQVNPNLVTGRVRLQGGDPTGTNPQRMRLRIVYSKI